MITCYSCDAEFEVKFAEEYEDEAPKYCPNCGTFIDVELDFRNEDQIEMFDEDDDDVDLTAARY